jgi:hypothetical protein
MSTYATAERFLAALTAITRASGDAGRLDAEFVRSLLDFGSETDDNVQCVERVGIRQIARSGEKRRITLALRRGVVPLADIVNAAEGSDLPQAVVDTFPSITQEDWDGVLRLMTLILISLESRDLDPERSDEPQ